MPANACWIPEDNACDISPKHPVSSPRDARTIASTHTTVRRLGRAPVERESASCAPDVISKGDSSEASGWLRKFGSLMKELHGERAQFRRQSGGLIGGERPRRAGKIACTGDGCA